MWLVKVVEYCHKTKLLVHFRTKWWDLNKQPAYKRGVAGPNLDVIYWNNSGRQLCIDMLNDWQDDRHCFHALYTLYTNFTTSLRAS